MKRKLTVAAALDFEFFNNIYRRSTEHLIFPVCKSYRRRNYDTVSRMNTDGIKIFHRADCDNISLTVADNFEFYLFPSADAFLNQNLRDRRKSESVCGDLVKFSFRTGNSAARSSKSKCRPNDNRIADNLRKLHSVIDILHNFRGNTRLADLLHCIFKSLPVLCLMYRQRVSAQKLDVMLVQKTAFRKLH